MRDSKLRLEDRLQVPIASLAYPFGKLRHHVTTRTVDLAREADYEQAVSTHAQAIADSDDDMCLPRIVVGNDTVSQLAEKVLGTIDWHAQRARATAPDAVGAFVLGSALTMTSDVADAPAVEADNAPRVVSVIITSYNYGRFLGGAIESVLAQTYSPLDIVVVDDGSTDETATVARSYAARGVAYVSTPRVGAARARNAGIGLTAGPLVAFLDADDTWLPNKIERQVAHLGQHPEVALVSCHAYACDEQMQRESIVHAAEEPSRWMLERLLVHNVVLNPTCVLVRRPALERVGGFSDLRKWEDWDTWLRIAKLSRLGFIPEVLADVRRHHRGLSPQDGYEHLALDQAIFDRHIMDVASPWKRRVLRRRARSVSYFHVARLMADHDRGAARRFSVRALLLDPTILTRRKIASVVRTHSPPWFATSSPNRARRRAGA